MSTSTGFDLDAFLESKPVDPGSLSGLELEGAEGSSGEAWREEGYTGTIDYRIRQLSYSSLLALHQCPRKFQLYKLRTTHREEESEQSSITFAYGHAVGEAIQLALQGFSYQDIAVALFKGWKPDLWAADDKSNKSLWSALVSVKKFIALREAGFLQEYELVYFQGKPACELSFCINFPDGFRLRGFVDAVLRHKITSEVLVLECKTTGSKTVSPSQFKNSAQAVGYSIVLDAIFHDLSSYRVLYLVNQSPSYEFTPIVFVKTYLQRALWIRELLLDIETIKMYEEAEVYPMHGESCYNFFRDCEYINSCTLSTQYLTKKCTAEEEDRTEYQITLSLKDLLDTQFKKLEGSSTPAIETTEHKDEML